MDLGVFLESPQGSQSLSRVGACRCAFLPSCSSSVTLPFPCILGSVAFPRGFPRGFPTTLSTVMSHVPPSCQSILGLKVDAMPGKHASASLQHPALQRCLDSDPQPALPVVTLPRHPKKPNLCLPQVVESHHSPSNISSLQLKARVSQLSFCDPSGYASICLKKWNICFKAKVIFIFLDFSSACP